MKAMLLNSGRYVVRPNGKETGTCGFNPDGTAWFCVYVNAKSEAQAIGKAQAKLANERR